MTDDTSPGADLAAQPLDAGDTALLSEVATMYDDVDPVPADLVQRVKFALALDEVFDEVAQITRVPVDAAAVRSGLADATCTDTLTFAAAHLSAMVTVTRSGTGRVRIDGWVSPVGDRRVIVRMQGTARETRADDSGRFVVDDLREGFAQLVFHPREDEATEGLVVTPLFKLSTAD